MRSDPTSQTFFEEKYAAAADPWAFATSTYEQYRYGTILAALAQGRYHRAFEPGCSIGVLTERLAHVCAHVEAMDISPTAVSRAQDRCRSLPNVVIKQGALPDQMPEGTFDLIVFSEIGYYFDRPTLISLARQLFNKLRTEGILLAVHWLGVSPDHRLSGEQVHGLLGATILAPTRSLHYEGFRFRLLESSVMDGSWHVAVLIPARARKNFFRAVCSRFL
jgi:SAM-dependent methyltransferase